MKHIETEIIINAKPQEIWKTLSNFENYPTWNPFIQSIKGELVEGTLLTVEINPPKGSVMTFKPVLLKVLNSKEIRWKGKLLVKGIFDGEHYFMLEQLNEQQTKFIQGEKFGGVLIPFLGKALENTKIGFQLMNEALKRECEKN